MSGKKKCESGAHKRKMVSRVRAKRPDSSLPLPPEGADEVRLLQVDVTREEQGTTRSAQERQSSAAVVPTFSPKHFPSVLRITDLKAVNGKTLYITVRDGDEATLSCENVMTDQDKCDRTTWVFIGSRNAAAVDLIKLGQIGEKAKAKSDTLSVTADCSLVIKKVTVRDVGRYFCRQYDRSGRKQGLDSVVLLSVVIMTEHKDNDMVKLICSVSTYGWCLHTVQWVYEGNDQDVNTQHMKELQSSCSATVEFTTSHLTEPSKYSELFKCRVTDKRSGKVQQFTFNSPSSDEDTNGAATKPTTAKPVTPTTKPATATTLGKSTEAKMNQTPPTTNQTKQQATIIGVAVGLASLLIIVLVLIRLKKSKRNKTQTDENIGPSLNTAVTPGTSQDMVDPEEGVSYASISYTKKTNSKARVHGDDDAVTYSTVKASSSSAGASTDPSNLYATVN
ncbi:uncharacterized protein LOC133998019 [Scomber scombrus]|uniref:uncharacterized protein LOC133998019 n=1 Tax=Scomber scombrus TaxID=13677 RepID=UPI002DDAF685|nr:uncharacterized protein LOC133998019 [Scomber scombrus]